MQIIHDINCLATEVCGDYLEHVLQLLSSCSADILDLVKQSILQGGKSLNDLAPLASNAIIEALVDKAVEVSFILKTVFGRLLFIGMRMLGFLLPLNIFLDVILTQKICYVSG